MPRLTMRELDGWIADFRRAESAADPRTVDMSWDQSTVDTALVIAQLGTSHTEVYLQRDIGGSAEWWATFEPRESSVRLGAADIARLTAEVAAVGRLCASLTERTAEHLEAARRAAG